jgi:ankyrin repeat protein
LDYAIKHRGEFSWLDCEQELQQFVDAGGNIDEADQYSCTLLHVACQHDKTGEVATVLVEQFGANANVWTRQAWTPAHVAAGNGNATALSMLLKNGADAFLKGDGGKTPHDVAREAGHTECMKILGVPVAKSSLKR